MEITSTWRFDAKGNAFHRVTFSPVYGHTIFVVSNPTLPKFIKTRSCAYVRSL